MKGFHSFFTLDDIIGTEMTHVVLTAFAHQNIVEISETYGAIKSILLSFIVIKGLIINTINLG